MTAEKVRAFCANNGISVSAPGEPLHVVDVENLPPTVREFVNDDGSYKGDDTPESEGDETEAVDVGTEGEAAEEDLSSFTVVELKDQARELEISGFSSMSKDELVKAVKKANK